VADEQLPVALRADAVTGLAASELESRRLLLALVSDSQAELRDEALRSLRGVKLSAQEKERLEQVAAGAPACRDLVSRVVSNQWKPSGRPDPQQPQLWQSRLAGGDAAAGERVFFHSQGARCATCHYINGRGGRIGPDLSSCGQMGMPRLLNSILAPSREIAPQFVHWSLLLRDGRTVTGLLLSEEGDAKRIYAGSDGTLRPIHRDEIDEARPLAKSVMPDGLADQMTDQELRDLMAYLLKCR
jgi:putative heme-binding domain-containing protein